MENYAPIGVLDSGVGGLTVLKVLLSLMPHEHFIYLGDTARAPFGTRSEAEIRQIANEMLDFYQERGVKQVIVACNTLTMLDVNTLQAGRPFQIIGVSHVVALLLKFSKKKRIGIMATPFTINSEVHKKEILSYDPEVKVCGVACPKLVKLVEQEQFNTLEMEAVIREYTEPLKKADVDVVALSCTHFPFVKKEIEKALGPDVLVIDPAGRTAANAHIQLHMRNVANHQDKGGAEIYFTANLERAKSLAKRMLPMDKCKFELVDLHSPIK